MDSGRLEVNLSGIRLKNPVMPASGCFGFGLEMAALYDLNRLGAVVLKGTTLHPRFGNPPPRIAECGSAGLLNAIGLQNPGVDAVIAEELPRLRECFFGPVVANISGFSVEEYVETAVRFDRSPVDILEINISCPNVRHGGMAFGGDPKSAAAVTSAVKKAVKKPIYLKLTPNVSSIAAIAAAAEDAGADGLTLINTLLGMRIEPRSGRPVAAIGAAGYSGPAIKPVAVRMVYQVASAVKIPIIGVGGIASADDVIEMMSAGASAVQVGSANLVDPFALPGIIDGLIPKMEEYGIAKIADITGRSFCS